MSLFYERGKILRLRDVAVRDYQNFVAKAVYLLLRYQKQVGTLSACHGIDELGCISLRILFRVGDFFKIVVRRPQFRQHRIKNLSVHGAPNTDGAHLRLPKDAAKYCKSADAHYDKGDKKRGNCDLKNTHPISSLV